MRAIKGPCAAAMPSLSASAWPAWLRGSSFTRLSRRSHSATHPAVASVEPSSTTRSSRAWWDCARTEEIDSPIKSAPLCTAMTTETSGGPATAPVPLGRPHEEALFEQLFGLANHAPLARVRVDRVDAPDRLANVPDSPPAAAQPPRCRPHCPSARSSRLSPPGSAAARRRRPPRARPTTGPRGSAPTGAPAPGLPALSRHLCSLPCGAPGNEASQPAGSSVIVQANSAATSSAIPSSPTSGRKRRPPAARASTSWPSTTPS